MSCRDIPTRDGTVTNCSTGLLVVGADVGADDDSDWLLVATVASPACAAQAEASPATGTTVTTTPCDNDPDDAAPNSELSLHGCRLTVSRR